MERVKQLFAGMRARDVAFMGGYALYLAFGYMSFESPTRAQIHKTTRQKPPLAGVLCGAQPARPAPAATAAVAPSPKNARRLK